MTNQIDHHKRVASKLMAFVRPRLPGLLWLSGDGFVTSEGGISKDPLFAVGGAIMSAGSVANLCFGEKSNKVFTAPSFILAGTLFAISGAIGHDVAKVWFGTGTALATVAMFYGNDLAEKFSQISPMQRLLKKFSKVRSAVVGELIYAGVNSSLIIESAKLIQEGFINHKSTNFIDAALLILGAVSYTTANRLLVSTPETVPEHPKTILNSKRVFNRSSMSPQI